MGKLSSRILQLILLSAITFPLLAIVRVFGGVPWSFLVSSICITLSTVVFVAALTLFFSIFTRRAYIVIIVALLTLALLFLGLGFQFFVRGPLYGVGRSGMLHSALFYMNPYAVLATSSDLMTDPSLAARVTLNWPLNCAILLGASVAILMVSTILVRKVAMLQASTSANVFVAWWRSRARSKARLKPSPRPLRPIRHVTGPPIVWRELICPLSSRYKYVSASIMLFELAMLLAIYLFPAVTDIVGYAGTHRLYVYIFMGFATLMTIVPSATTITLEKESCTWPLLLSTAVSDWQIILGKIAGALRRSLLLWILLVVYLVLFSWARLLHAVSIIQIAMIGISILVILTASGIYFSARLRHTTTAVMVNFGFALAVWLILPVLCIAVMEILHAGRSWWAIPYEMNPFFQAGVVIEATADLWQLSYYHQIAPFQWYHRDMTMVQSTWFIFASMLMYLLFAAVLIWRAKRILRRDIC
jgi:ABC-type transport system involved in multi-copper enzyme maturation permease subunit